MRPGDWIVLWACLACLLLIVLGWAAYLITHP